jgi:hypothetical protein
MNGIGVRSLNFSILKHVLNEVLLCETIVVIFELIKNCAQTYQYQSYVSVVCLFQVKPSLQITVGIFIKKTTLDPVVAEKNQYR